MVEITGVRAILTQPGLARLVVVKVSTSEPDLFGLGCATFTQRPFAVHAAISHHLAPLLVGRDVDRIEDIWQMSMNHAYWRNGPVLNNAVSGVDQALWDIKGKRAAMPVYQLLGGRTREAATLYAHADGRDPQEVAENARALMEQGYRHVRVQMGLYGGPTHDLRLPLSAPPGSYFDPRGYSRPMLEMIDHVRATLGGEVELLHDVHERLHPIDAVRFAKDLEQYGLFFLEDPFAPEDIGWFRTLRQQCATPLAMGELFNNPHEWRPLITGRLIDFVRMHVSQIGGITPARGVASFAAMFGIQEWPQPSEIEYEMFPGLPRAVDGYLYPSDRPGLGIDIDEILAARFPCDERVEEWTQTRLPDGSPARP